jgi:hypothetical protein
MEGTSLDRRPWIAEHFGRVLNQLGTRGVIGEVVQFLATGDVAPDSFRTVRVRHGLHREDWLRGQILDLVLDCVREILADGVLTADRQADVRALRLCLEIPDGEFMDRRPAELAAILGEELDRILEDSVIDEGEELYQVELQALFGIGYDDYLALTRTAFEGAHTELSEFARSSSAAATKLAALEPIYQLVISHHRRLGALY